jgi:hypothetical protein
MHAAIVVGRSSADPGIGESVPIMNADHGSICKPRSGDSPVYRMVRRVIMRAVTKARKGSLRPVFDVQAQEIFQMLRVSRFRMLAEFIWESNGPMTENDRPKDIKDIPKDQSKSYDSKETWDENQGKNLRRRVAVEFFRQCEERIRSGAVEITSAEEDAALYSQFDIDKLMLIAWRKYRLEQALKDVCALIEEQCGYVRGTYEPTLTVLYRAIDSMDKALTDQLTLSLGTELRLVRDAIAARSQTEEKLDGDGITRGRIDDLVAKIRTMAEISLTTGLPNRRQ